MNKLCHCKSTYLERVDNVWDEIINTIGMGTLAGGSF